MSRMLLFPGQGAQRSGMLQALSAEILQEASDALGEDVRRLDSAQALKRAGQYTRGLQKARAATAEAAEPIPHSWALTFSWPVSATTPRLTWEGLPSAMQKWTDCLVSRHRLSGS